MVLVQVTGQPANNLKKRSKRDPPLHNEDDNQCAANAPLVVCVGEYPHQLNQVFLDG